MKSRFKYNQIRRLVFFPYFSGNSRFDGLNNISERPSHRAGDKQQEVEMIRHKPEFKYPYFRVMRWGVPDCINYCFAGGRWVDICPGYIFGDDEAPECGRCGMLVGGHHVDAPGVVVVPWCPAAPVRNGGFPVRRLWRGSGHLRVGLGLGCLGGLVSWVGWVNGRARSLTGLGG